MSLLGKSVETVHYFNVYKYFLFEMMTEKNYLLSIHRADDSMDIYESKNDKVSLNLMWEFRRSCANAGWGRVTKLICQGIKSELEKLFLTQPRPIKQKLLLARAVNGWFCSRNSKNHLQEDKKISSWAEM